MVSLSGNTGMLGQESGFTVDISLVPESELEKLTLTVPRITVLQEDGAETFWVGCEGQRISFLDCQDILVLSFSAILSESEAYISRSSISGDRFLYFVDETTETGRVVVLGIETGGTRGELSMISRYLTGNNMPVPEKIVISSHSNISRASLFELWLRTEVYLGVAGRVDLETDLDACEISFQD